MKEFNSKNETKFQAVHEKIKQALRELFVAVFEGNPGMPDSNVNQLNIKILGERSLWRRCLG